MGECAKVHEYALRADFERSQKDKDYFYDVDVSQVYIYGKPQPHSMLHLVVA